MRDLRMSRTMSRFHATERGRRVQSRTMTDLGPVLLDSLRSRITRIFPAQVRAAVEMLSDEEIWWRPNESSNSVGNLVLHLAGSLNHYLNRNLGGLDYNRDREAEFAERRQIPRAELMAAFDAMVANAEKTFEALTPERLEEPSPEPKMNHYVLQDLIGVLSHISAHAAQIVWIAKMLREGGADDVWIKSHRDLGGWTAARPRSG